MKVLYVSAALSEDTRARRDLEALDPMFEVEVVAGAAAALVEVRNKGGYQALFLSPQLPPNEALALIATLRRDRIPVAIVPIITEDQRQFFAPAITAGADDVLMMRNGGFFIAEETVRRVRHSRHVNRSEDQARMRVLFVGQDDLAWDLLSDMPFIIAERAEAAADGSSPTTLTKTGGQTAELIILDEITGEAHALQVVKWLKSHAPSIPLVVLTSPTGVDIGGAALDLGAEDVVSKAGMYRRRLIATLHRHYIKSAGAAGSAGPAGSAGSAGPSGPAGPAGPQDEEPVTYETDEAEDVREDEESPAEPEPVAAPVAKPEPPAKPTNGEAEEIARIRAALAAETRIRDLTAEVHSLSAALASARQANVEAREAQGFERAMRDRDREELGRLRQALTEERERRTTAEQTLRQAEDRARADADALASKHASATRELESQLATAADRLHEVANQTQVLHTRLESELSVQTAERERLIASELFGYARVSEAGALLECNQAFARMFGFDHAEDAVAASSAGTSFSGLADHAHVVEELRAGNPINRVESVVQRPNGRPFHVITSAAFLPAVDDNAPVIERLFIDLGDRTQREEQLRLARRLESAGRLAAEMSGEIDPLLASVGEPSAEPATAARAAALVRQLLAYSRRQAKPAGLLSLRDAILRAEPQLRQLAGDGVTFELRLEDVGPITASEEDIEQLLSALVSAATGSLPYGGTIVLETRSLRSGFDQRTELSVGASGYGVHTAPLSPSLARLVTRCGGTVRVADEPARSTVLHVHLPC